MGGTQQLRAAADRADRPMGLSILAVAQAPRTFAESGLRFEPNNESQAQPLRIASGKTERLRNASPACDRFHHLLNDRFSTCLRQKVGRCALKEHIEVRFVCVVVDRTRAPQTSQFNEGIRRTILSDVQ